MKVKRFFLILFSISLCIPLASCKSESPIPGADIAPNTPDTTISDPKPEAPDAEVDTPTVEKHNDTLAAIADSLKINGRAYVQGSGIVCDLAADGIEFNAYLVGRVTLSLYSNNPCYFTVWIDGERAEERLCASAGNTSLTIAEFAEGGEHHIRILKQTESMNALVMLNKLSYTGDLTDRPVNSRSYVEFIGDSLTSGYGILCNSATPDGGSSVYKDATKSFAFLAAEALQADCSLVSCTGIGVVDGYREFRMSDFYPATSYYRDSSNQYVSRRTPDAVVINLGTNDRTKGVSGSDFYTAVKALITQVRHLHGENVPIVWVTNANNSTLNSSIRQAITDLGGETNKLYTVEISLDSNGSGNHPSEASQAKEATTVSKFLQDKLGL